MNRNPPRGGRVSFDQLVPYVCNDSFTLVTVSRSLRQLAEAECVELCSVLRQHGMLQRAVQCIDASECVEVC